MSVNVETCSGNIYAIFCSNFDDKNIVKTHLKYLLDVKQMRAEREKRRIQVERTIKNVGINYNLIYGISLVKTVHSENAKRGAQVIAISLLSRLPFVHVFKPILILAFDKYLKKQDLSILESLFVEINGDLDLSQLPELDIFQTKILRGGNPVPLFPEHTQDVVTMEGKYFKPLTKDVSTSNLKAKLTYSGLKSTWESHVSFDGISVPVKVPIDVYPGEVGEFSIMDLINTFHPAQSKYSEPSGFMIIVHALLSQKRIIFLGAQISAKEVAKYVLAACALCSPILKGFENRAFPYISLHLVEYILSVPGFIAGVTNPAFQNHEEWWDILCDIPTGRIFISPNCQSYSPYGPLLTNSLHPPSSQLNSSGSDISAGTKDKEKELVARDLDFMRQIHKLMAKKFDEYTIRQKISFYVGRFVDIAMASENVVPRGSSFSLTSPMRSFKSSPLGSPRLSSSSIDNLESPKSPRIFIRPGSNADISGKNESGYPALYGPPIKRKEILAYSRRVHAWKSTISYRIFMDEQNISKNFDAEVFENSAMKRSSDASEADSKAGNIEDFSQMIALLKSNQQVDSFQLGTILKQISQSIEKQDMLHRFLSYFPFSDGGLYPLSELKTHENEYVQIVLGNLISTLKNTSIGTSFLNSTLQEGSIHMRAKSTPTISTSSTSSSARNVELNASIIDSTGKGDSRESYISFNQNTNSNGRPDSLKSELPKSMNNLRTSTNFSRNSEFGSPIDRSSVLSEDYRISTSVVSGDTKLKLPKDAESDFLKSLPDMLRNFADGDELHSLLQGGDGDTKKDYVKPPTAVSVSNVKNSMNTSLNGSQASLNSSLGDSLSSKNLGSSWSKILKKKIYSKS